MPLKPYDVITMVVDTHEGTLRYLVNGIDAGVAFGPSGSGAVCELPDGEAPFSWGGGAALFPSCSLTNDKQARAVLRQRFYRTPDDGHFVAAEEGIYVRGVLGQNLRSLFRDTCNFIRHWATLNEFG